MKSALRLLALVFCLLSPFLLTQSVTGRENVNVSENINLLVLGKDDASDLADAVVLLNVDTTAKSVTCLQIPRDTYIELDGLNYKKVNGLSKQLGSDAAACKVISETMGVHIDGYISVDLAAVRKIVDTLGGIELYVPMDMDYDDPYQDLSIHIKKGYQRLSGDEAVGFIRYRDGYLRADVARMDAQKIFLSALAKKMTSQIASKDIMPLLNLAVKYVKTDLTVVELFSLCTVMLKVVPKDINFATMPGEAVQSKKSKAWFYILSKSGCEELLKTIKSADGFDKNHVYSNKTYAEFERIYNTKIEANVYNASQIDSEGIEIIPK